MSLRYSTHTIAAMLVASCLSLCVATPAMAQDNDGVFSEENRSLLITLGVITTASLSTYVLQGITDRVLDKIFADAHRYMRHNAVALKQDISVGGGAALQDLAALLRLPVDEQGAFFERVRQRHLHLITLLQGDEMEMAQVHQFVEIALTDTQYARITALAE